MPNLTRAYIITGAFASIWEIGNSLKETIEILSCTTHMLIIHIFHKHANRCASDILKWAETVQITQIHQIDRQQAFKEK